MNWGEGKDSRGICWLSGPAGFGKSAIMQTAAERLKEMGVLAASFFFLGGAGLRSEFTRFITTIAYHISLSIPTSQPFIQRALQKDPTVPSHSMQDQLRELVLEPLGQTPLGTKPLVVVVDALDECDDRESIVQFIGLLAQTCSEDRLPLRFLLASRAEDHIRQAFASNAAQSSTYLLELETFNAGGDITLFLGSKFNAIRERSPRLFQDTPGEWPSSKQLTALAKKSEGLFIFAATVVSFVTDGKGSPQEKLTQVLDSHLGLDPLYTQVLSSANRDDVFDKVLSTIIYLRRQLSITALAGFLDLTSETVVDRLTEIQSIIRIPAHNHGSVQLNHASFRDFLLDKARSKNYHLPSSCEIFIVIRSMTIMTKALKRDEWPSDDAEKYACREWCFHLDGAIRGCTSLELARKMSENLQMFTRSDALEVWINTVFRSANTPVTIECLRDTKPLLQVRVISSNVLTGDALTLFQVQVSYPTR
jgi:archaellum biogenesis ATPase FlaH